MASKKKLKISKLDAAKRQLETAIRLYFNSADPISIHTLACAAHGIISDLNKKYKGAPMVMDGWMIKDEFQKEMVKMFRSHQNFFKHANKDPEKNIDFNPDVTECHIVDAIFKYREITGEQVTLFNIFQGWFSGHHIDLFVYSEEQRKFILDSIALYNNNRSEYFSEMLQVTAKIK